MIAVAGEQFSHVAKEAYDEASTNYKASYIATLAVYIDAHKAALTSLGKRIK